MMVRQEQVQREFGHHERSHAGGEYKKQEGEQSKVETKDPLS